MAQNRKLQNFLEVLEVSVLVDWQINVHMKLRHFLLKYLLCFVFRERKGNISIYLQKMIIRATAVAAGSAPAWAPPSPGWSA